MPVHGDEESVAAVQSGRNGDGAHGAGVKRGGLRPSGAPTPPDITPARDDLAIVSEQEAIDGSGRADTIDSHAPVPIHRPTSRQMSHRTPAARDGTLPTCKCCQPLTARENGERAV